MWRRVWRVPASSAGRRAAPPALASASRCDCDHASPPSTARCAAWRNPLAPLRTKRPRNLHAQRHHALVPLRLVVREWHLGLVQETQRLRLEVPRPQRQPVARLPFLAPLRARRAQRLQTFVVLQCLPGQAVVTLLEPRDQARIPLEVLRTHDPRRSARPPRQSLHGVRPRLPVDLRQRFQFAQVMRVASRVPHVRHREIRLPWIMHETAPQAPQQAAPPRARARGWRCSRERRQ